MKEETKDIVIQGYNAEEVEIIKSQIAPGCSDQELKHFAKVCQKKGLDPFSKQIYALKRKTWDGDSNGYIEKMSIQTSIDGYRVIAARTGLYEGQMGPFWCGPDGKWIDVWLSVQPPSACKVGALRKGCKEPFWCMAVYTSYVQTKRDGKPMAMWAKMPDLMLAKCAESLALRKAFPEDLSGIYTDDEMGSADNDPKTTAQAAAVNHAVQAIENKMESKESQDDMAKELIAIHTILKTKGFDNKIAKDYLATKFGKKGMELSAEEMLEFKTWAQCLEEFKLVTMHPSPIPYATSPDFITPAPINGGVPYDPNFDQGYVK